MKIVPKKEFVLIEKLKNTKLSVDMITEDSEEDKNLILGRIISSSDENYKEEDIVVFGKYSLFPCTIKGEEYFFLQIDDIIASVIDFK